jgi:hypothetical protein
VLQSVAASAPFQGRYVFEVDAAGDGLSVIEGDWDGPYTGSTHETAVGSRGQLRLGLLRRGAFTRIGLLGRGSFASRYTVKFTPLPLTFEKPSLSHRAIRPSNETALRFTPTNEADVVVSVRDAHGRVIRTLVQAHAAASAQLLRWNGFRGGGRPVPDGRYHIDVQGQDPAGSRAQFGREVTVDGTAPKVTVISPRRLTANRAFVASIRDDWSQLAGTRVTVDGGHPRSVPPLSTRVARAIVIPSGGWRPGRHVVSISVSDVLGNKRTIREVIRVPHH